MKFLQLLSLAIALFTCGQTYSSQPKTPANQSIPCPSQKFSEFFHAFAEDVVVQQKFTSFPLKKLELDITAEPEPKPIVRDIEFSKTLFPVVPNEAKRKQELLTYRINNLSADRVELTLEKNDTDYKILYFFSKQSCWKLERIEDWSL